MGGDFQILITNLSGKKIPVTVNPSMKIKELKAKILENGQFESCMISNGIKLLNDDEQTIGFYEITPSTSLYMLGRVKGGLQ